MIRYHRWQLSKNNQTARLIRALIFAAALVLGAHPTSAQSVPAVLLTETFEDGNFAARGWYDGTSGTVTNADHYSGSSCLKAEFTVGKTAPWYGMRHALAETESIYLSYYVKYSTNWVGSGRPYHPHLFYFHTDEDGPWVGASSHLTVDAETIWNTSLGGGLPTVQIADNLNIDETKIGVDLVRTTENRAVGGCNGDSDGYGNGTCYLDGAAHFNGKAFQPARPGFTDAAGPLYKNAWHHVEYFVKLNTIAGGIGQRDGVTQVWVDGTLFINHTDVVYRTGTHAALRFNQVLLAPYIGDGSPIDQTMWIDSLTIATAPPTSQPPRAPTNVRILAR